MPEVRIAGRGGNAFPYFLLLTISFALYARSVGFPFLGYDDTLLIVENQDFLQDLRNVPRAFLQDAWSVPGHVGQGSYYRPLYTLSFMFDAQFAGTAPAFYHCTSILLHGLVSCLVFALLFQLGTARFPALTLSLFFALHPAFVSVVAWIPGRNDSLLAAFVLAAVLSLERFAATQKLPYMILHFGFLLASFFTKESALAFLLVGCVWLATIGKYRLKRFQKQMFLIGWSILAVFWIALRLAAISPRVPDFNLIANLAENWIFLIHYLGKALLPARLALFPTLADTAMFPGLAVLAGLGLLLVFRAFAALGQALFGISWFLLFLLPTLPVPVLVGLEQRLYLPMVGILILLASVKQIRILSATRLQITAIAFLLVVVGSLAWTRLSALGSRESFWAAAVAASPHSSLALFNLGSVELNKGNLKEAENLLKRALRINPREPMANNNLGILCIRRKNRAEAVRYFEKEIQINSEYADAYFNLGVAYQELGQIRRAVEQWERALEKDPAHARALRFLADHYLKVGDQSRANRYLQQLAPAPK